VDVEKKEKKRKKKHEMRGKTLSIQKNATKKKKKNVERESPCV